MDTQELERYMERLETAFHTVMRKIGPELSEQLDPNLTGAQFFIVRYLFRKQEVTVSDLAKIMHVNPSAITAMIDRLHKNGLVLRDRDEEDRRLVRIRLSEHGLEVFKKAEAKRKEILRRHFAHLTEAELETLVAIYEKLARIVQKQV